MERKMNFVAAMCLAMLIWGGSWVCAKAISHGMHYQKLTLIRFGLTTLFLVPPLIAFRESLRIDRRTLLKLLLGGLLYALYSQMFFLGLSLGRAGIGGVLVTTLVPVLTFAAMSLLTRKGIRAAQAAGLAAGLAGALVILKVWSLDAGALLASGNLFFIAGALLWSGVTMNSQDTQRRISIWVYSFYLNGFAVLIQALFTVSAGFEGLFPADPAFWTYMVYLSLLSTVFATTVYFFAAKRIGSRRASAFTFLVPASAVLLSWIFLGERPEATTLIGGSLSAVAVSVLQRENAEEKAAGVPVNLESGG